MSLCVSCAPKQPETIVQTKYVFMIPEKVATPTKPEFREYDKTKYLYQAPNFSRLQQNTILLKNYANTLKDTVTYYEKAIDEMQAKRAQLEQPAIDKK